MTWLPLKPLAQPAVVIRSAAVTLAGNMANGKARAALSLIIRTRMMEAAPTWCAPARSLTAQLGAGEHAGMVRLMAAAPFDFTFGRPGGKNTEGHIMLRLPWPKGATPANVRATAVQFDYQADWLEFTLPDWAQAPQLAPAPAPAATMEAATHTREPLPVPPLTKPAAKLPFISQASRTPDPAAADRLAQREGRA
jgi:hypothetical protein